MHILIFKFRHSPDLQGFVCRTKTSMNKLRKEELETFGNHIEAWRYHDGTGWADGSPDAWEMINQIPHRCRVILG